MLKPDADLFGGNPNEFSSFGWICHILVMSLAFFCTGQLCLFDRCECLLCINCSFFSFASDHGSVASTSINSLSPGTNDIVTTILDRIESLKVTVDHPTHETPKYSLIKADEPKLDDNIEKYDNEKQGEVSMEWIN